MQTGPGQCLDNCTCLLTDLPYHQSLPLKPFAPNPQNIKELKLLNMAYEASYLAPDDLTGFIFCCSSSALWISDLGKSSFESKNAMILIDVCEILHKYT